MRLIKYDTIDSLTKNGRVELGEIQDQNVGLDIKELPADFDLWIDEKIPGPVQKEKEDDAIFKCRISRWRRIQNVAMIYESAVEGEMAFDKKKDEFDTLTGFYEYVFQELLDYGFSIAQFMKAVQQVMLFNDMTEKAVKEAQKDFLPETA